jgi:hypothetical protein
MIPIRYRSPLSLPRLTLEDMMEGGKAGIWFESSEAPRTYWRKAPAFIDQPHATRLFERLDPVPVVYPPAFAFSVPNAILSGFRTIVTPDGAFLNDQLFASDSHKENFFKIIASAGGVPAMAGEPTGLVRVSDEPTFELRPGAAPRVRLTGKVLVLGSSEPGNYGSFIFRILPKIAPFLDRMDELRVLVWAGAPSMQELLILAGVPAERIILQDVGAIYDIEQAIIPGMRNPQGLLDEETLAFYAGMRERWGQKPRGRKIYVSRFQMKASGQRGRAMQNEFELITELLRLGFDILQPQSLSAREQILAFSAASLVVGPSGSGMFNAVFCHPGAKLIDIESEPNWIHAHMCLFGSLGLDFGIFEGQAADRDWSRPHKPFSIEIDALLERVRRLDG